MRMSSVIKTITTVSFIGIIMLLGGIFALQTQTSQADNLYGESCGGLTCTGTQTCQKSYRGVLPIESPSGGTLGDLIGGLVGNLTGNNQAGNLAGQVVDGQIQNGQTIEPTYTCVDSPKLGAPDSIYKGPQVNGYNTSIPRPGDPGVPVNIINGGPIPVDIFNPNPVPTTIVSPTPLPVVVIDDLAMYQQKELVDAPINAAQKSKTLGNVSSAVIKQISEQGLTPQNYDQLRIQGIDYGVLDPNTGIVDGVAMKTYADSHISLDILDQVRDRFTDLKEQRVSFAAPNFNEVCGGQLEDAGKISFDCALLALQNQNNENSIYNDILIKSQLAAEDAKELLNQEVANGGGFLAKTQDNDQNPYTKAIQTPGAVVGSILEETLLANIENVVGSDQCFSSIPTNILDGTINPALKDGLFFTQDSTSLSQIGDKLLENLTAGVTCKISQTLQSLTDDLINDINNINI